MADTGVLRIMIAAVAVAVFAVGCTTVGQHRYHGKNNGHPANPSMTVPRERKPVLTGNYQLRNPIPAKGRSSIVGVWEMVQEHNTVSVSTGSAKPFEHSQVVKNRYWFYEDGTLRLVSIIGGKETGNLGSWEYRDGILSMCFKNRQTGRDERVQMNVLWYSGSEFELRYADLRAYEKMFGVAESIKSVNASYAPDGVMELRMKMEFSAGNITGVSIFNSIYSPMICERTGDIPDEE